MQASFTKPLSPAVLLIGTLALTLWAYLPSLANNFFHLDDPVYITAITHWTWRNVLGLFLSGAEGYHPLTLLTLSANHYWAGLDPFSYHLINLLLHTTNTALVFFLIQSVTRHAFLACMTATLFGLHPVHVESVAWIASRKDVQYALFYLTALLAYRTFLRARQPGWYALALICGLLAVFSKGMAITLGLALLLLDYLSERSFRNGRVWIEKAPFLVMGLVFGLINVHYQQARGYVPPTESMAPLLDRLFGAAHAFALYLFNFCMPLRLSAYHPYPAMEAATRWIGTGAVLMYIVVTALTLRRSRGAAFGLLFFAAHIAPVLQLVPVSTFVIADRYNYVSSIGLCLLVGIGLRRALAVSRPAAWMSAFALAAVLAWLGWSTFLRCQVWKDTFSVWNDVLRVYPRAPLALQERAYEYYARGQYEAADRDLTLAIEQAPSSAEPYLLRGVTRFLTGHPTDALADLNRAIALDPREPKAHMNRGLVHFALQDSQQALDDLTRAIALDRGPAPQAHAHRGRVKLALNDPEGAAADAARALQSDPRLPLAYEVRAQAHERLGQLHAALADWRRAAELDPANTNALEAVGRLATAP